MKQTKTSYGLVIAACLAATAGLGAPARAATNSSVAQTSAIWTILSTSGSPAELQSITVKAPANGNIVVTASGQVNYVHVTGTQGVWCMAMSQTSGDDGGCIPNAGSSAGVRNYIAAGVPSSVPSFGTYEQYSVSQVYPVKSGTSYTFYLNGFTSGFTSAALFQAQMTALFVPGTLAQ